MKALIKDFCALTLKLKSQVFGYIESLYAFYSYASPWVNIFHNNKFDWKTLYVFHFHFH